MIRNYFKTAWRNLVKNKFYSFINISGLAVGLAVGLIILLWVQDEIGFDRFHSNARNIYKLENMVGTGASRQLWTSTAAPIGKLVKNEIPGVENYVRILFDGNFGIFKSGNKAFSNEEYLFTDPSFFSVFNFPIINGNASNPFPADHSIVITEETAHKYFGVENAVGKIITIDDTLQFRVAAIVKNFPQNSTIHSNIIFPMEYIARQKLTDQDLKKNLDNDFSNYNYQTFLQLKPGFNFQGFADKIRNIHLRMKPDDTDIGYVFLPLEKWHLFHSDGSEGGYASVRMFFIIAILILVIACINYVNLSTARSMLRAKEVSLRKIVGAARMQLFMQFIVETALLFLFSAVAALVLVYLCIPLFNTVSGKQLVLNFYDPAVWEVIVLTVIGTLIISSIYPAMLLSSFQPIKALKGKLSNRISNALFRRVLVVIQFSFSVILIAGTIIIAKQLAYIRSKQLGYDKENVFAFSMINMADHVDAVKATLLNNPGVIGVTMSNGNIVNFGGQTGDNEWQGKQVGETVMVSPFNVDKDFFSFFKLKMVEGQSFAGTVSDSTHFILNETAVKAMQLKNPVGQKFRLWKTEGTIIGVAKDFHFSSMRNAIQPAVFLYQPLHYGNVYVKTTGRDAPLAIAAAKQQWEQYNSKYDFKYAFLDETFDRLYQAEDRRGMLFDIFASIAIFISCLGLLGLAAYTAQVRTREIGVRKVLGSSVTGIIRLLAIDFVKLVGVAVVISIPVAWYVMNQWLKDFAYKTSISWWVFLLAGIIAVTIAIVTISFQSVKAALSNPVKSLRTE